MLSLWKSSIQRSCIAGQLGLMCPLLDSQKRLEQQKPSVVASTTSQTNSTSTTVSPAQKVMVAPLSGSVTPGTKMVLAAKVGSPATVTFQQNKNFHQTFATWVKQGQSNSGRAGMNEILLYSGLGRAFLTFRFLRELPCRCLRRQAVTVVRPRHALFVETSLQSLPSVSTECI